jgi:pyruvate ferredoxin oxidoreductase beta subunit
MQNYTVYVPRLVTKRDNFVAGHRACTGCGEALAVRIACKALGNEVIIANATGCMEIVSSQLPYTAWLVPWIHTLFENTAAVASAIEAGLKVLKRKGKGPSYDINVVAMGGDGGTSDIGLQALSGAFLRGHKLLYICFDNEGYMNTGNQRSSATPYGAATTTSPPGKMSIGQMNWKKNMPEIAVAHGVSYVATATPSYPFDMIAKVKRGLATPGPAYIHVLSVCPTGWRSPTELSVRLGRLAVQTGIFPLYEVINRQYKISFSFPKLRPVKDYMNLQGRFRHLTDDSIKIIQERVSNEYHQLVEKAECKRKHE